MKTLGERIRWVREVQHLAPSQAAAAKMLGVSLPTYGRYESGERTPPADFLQKITEILEGVDAGWLLTGKASNLSHAERNYLEILIERIEGADGGEKSRQILMATYTVGVMMDNLHSPGLNLIGKILDYASTRIHDLHSRFRDSPEPPVEEHTEAMVKLRASRARMRKGMSNNQSNSKIPPEKKGGESAENSKRGKKK